MESRRKGREVIRMGHVLLGQDSEEKGEMGRDLLWEVSSSSHRLGAPALTTNMG